MVLKRLVPIFVACLLQGNFVEAMDSQPTEVHKVKFERLSSKNGPATALATFVNQDSKYIIAGFKDGKIYVWDFASKSLILVLSGHTDIITSLDVLQKTLNKFIVSGSLDGTVKLWNLETGQCVTTFNCQEHVLSAAIYDNYAVSLSGDGDVIIWDFMQKCEIRRFRHDHATFLSYNGQGGFPIYTASKEEVKMWSASQDNCQLTLPIQGKISGLLSFFLLPWILVAKTLDNANADSYDVLYTVLDSGKVQYHCNNNDLTTAINTYQFKGWQITLACTDKKIFRVYESYQGGNVIWSGADADNDFVPSKVASLGNYLVYASNDTNDIMVSCEPVLPNANQENVEQDIQTFSHGTQQIPSAPWCEIF